MFPFGVKACMLLMNKTIRQDYFLGNMCCSTIDYTDVILAITNGNVDFSQYNWKNVFKPVQLIVFNIAHQVSTPFGPLFGSRGAYGCPMSFSNRRTSDKGQ